jgi:hypothetical protein
MGIMGSRLHFTQLSGSGLVGASDNPDVYTCALFYYYDQSGNRTWVADDVNGGRDYVPDDLNQYTSIVRSTINNGNEHEVSSYKGPSDARLVNYTYLNDEHLVSVNDGTGGGANHYNLERREGQSSLLIQPGGILLGCSACRGSSAFNPSGHLSPASHGDRREEISGDAVERKRFLPR